MDIINKIRGKLISYLLPKPFSCRHAEYSIIASLDDDQSTRMSDRLWDISIKSIQEAKTVDLSNICERSKYAPYYVEIWPGEHYKLLAAIVSIIKPKLVIEIGTFTGASALSMLKSLPSEGKLVSFDIMAWFEVPGTILTNEDFADGRLEQRLGDLADPLVFENNRELLKDADIIFVDGPKNINFEKGFLNNIEKLMFTKSPLFIFDDIRIWNMLTIWRTIKKPKVDLTSFGHWSGTGLVDWC